MFPATRALLTSFYRPFNEKLAALLNDDRWGHALGVVLCCGTVACAVCLLRIVEGKALSKRLVMA